MIYFMPLRKEPCFQLIRFVSCLRHYAFLYYNIVIILMLYIIEYMPPPFASIFRHWSCRLRRFGHAWAGWLLAHAIFRLLVISVIRN